MWMCATRMHVHWCLISAMLHGKMCACMGMFTHARADVQTCASIRCMHACICLEERGAGRVTLAASRLTTPSTTELPSHNHKGRRPVGTDVGHVAVCPISMHSVVQDSSCWSLCCFHVERKASVSVRKGSTPSCGEPQIEQPLSVLHCVL